MVTLIGKSQANPFFPLKLSQSSAGLDWKQNRLTGNSQFMSKPTLSVPQQIVLACFQHFSSHESLPQDFIKAKMGCFLGEQYILLHIGLFSHITENSNEVHPRVTSAVLFAIPYYSYVSVAVCVHVELCFQFYQPRLMMWLSHRTLEGFNGRARRSAKICKAI